ncbi:hypothetical protein [Microvirga rosea]|uniref:hypothetical protein n=1 Tax=Microvirga rosea TaxID=2715425 RepID=UPI003872DC3C
MLVRWPSRIEADCVANGIVQHYDWLPTFLAMAGASDVVEKLTTGWPWVRIGRGRAIRAKSTGRSFQR